jgi:hypothetical protein
MIHPIPFENLINPSRGYLDPVVALQKPGNSQLSKMICLAKIENLFFDFLWNTEGRIFRARFTIDQSFLSMGSISLFPLIKSLPGYSEVAAGLRDINNLLSISEDTELPSDITLTLCHTRPPLKKYLILTKKFIEIVGRYASVGTLDTAVKSRRLLHCSNIP